jgi:hypothetical protein
MINGHAPHPPLSSLLAAIPVGPEPRYKWSAHSETRTNDLAGPMASELPSEATTITEYG